MIVVLRHDTPAARRDELVQELEGYGLSVRCLVGGDRTLLHVVSGPTRRVRRIARARDVEALVPTSGPRLRREGHRIYPYHFIHWSAAGILILGAMVLLAGLAPPGSGAARDSSSAPDALSWPWYVAAPRALLTALGREGRGWGTTILLGLALALFLLPFLDRTRGVGARARWPFALVSLVLVALVACAVFGGGAS